nr:integrase family protein [uncultured bacterium]
MFMGMIYKRGKTWWIKYYRNGKPYRESAKSHKEADAKRLLKRREGEISQGKLPGVLFDKVRFDELAEDFLMDYRINSRKTLRRAQESVNHLKEAFEGVRVPNITTPRIQGYIEDRMKWTCQNCEERFECQNKCPSCDSENVKPGAANATINRELAALKRMLNLGARQNPPKVDRVPYIPMLKENNTRKGFFEHGEFLAMKGALPSHLHGFVTFAYHTGWRISEIAGLTWAQVDREQGIVRLEVGDTKNDEGRTIYMDDELKEVFDHEWEHRRNLLPYVFLNAQGTDKVKRFDKAWKKACTDAGIGIRLFHDFRRTAVRNMVRAGTPERVAMMISGHKTRSVFERYNIVSDTDLRLAAQRQEEYLKSQMGTISGTISDLKLNKNINKTSQHPVIS